jgi:hypothetical protein
VYPGSAVTIRGDVVTLPEAKTVTVASLQRNTVSLVILKKEEIQSSTLAVATTGQTVAVGYEQSYSLFTAPLESYLDKTLFSGDTLADSVVLASIVWTDSDVPLVLTDDSYGYSFVRPWFSAVDVEHRSAVGSGTVSSTNPHGVGLSDLTVGSMTLYDQLTNSGMILSKAMSVPGVPGYICFDQFDATTIKTDIDGTVTSKSWFSHPGCRYIELSVIPNTVCSVRTTGNQLQEWAVDWIKGTKICVIVADSVPTALDAYFITTDTGRINNVTSTSISFTGVKGKDIVVTGGVGKTNLLRTIVPLKKYGTIPKRVAFIAGPNGQIYSDPTVLLTSTLINSVIGKVIAVETIVPAPGRVGIGLTDGMKSSQTSFCAVQVIGVDADGNEIQEVLSFDSSNWNDTSIPAVVENLSQIHFTEKTFSSVVSVQVLNTDSYPCVDVGNASMIVYLKQEAVYSKFATLANAFWDGTELIDLRDARRVLTTVREGTYGYGPMHQAAELIPGIDDVLGKGRRAQLIFVEDFSQPAWMSADTVEWDGLGFIDYDVIPSSLVDSKSVTSCYRSRQVPLKVDPASWTKICVVLFDSDPNINVYGTVRATFQKDGYYGEACLHPQVGDSTRSVFIGFAQTNWASVSITVTGKCRGFACYFVWPDVVDASYNLTTH